MFPLRGRFIDISGRLLVSLAFLALPLTGCIESDEITTVAIRPDGAARVTIVRSNTRSSASGEQGQKELAKYREEFDQRKDSEMTRVQQAGGTVTSAVWIQPVEPLASAMTFELPDARSLERYFTFGDTDPPPVVTRFLVNGQERSLVVTVTGLEPKSESTSRVLTVDELRQRVADGISEIRFTPISGKITSAQGFIVAGNARSAIFDHDYLEKHAGDSPSKLELRLTWTVAE